MSISLRGFLLMLTASALVAVSGLQGQAISEPAVTGNLQPVPLPALDSFETSVRDQLEAERQDFDQKVESGDLEGEELGRAYGELGRLYLSYDLLEPAEASFRNASSLQPDDFRWPHYLGFLMASQGRYEAARSEFDEAVRRNSTYASTWDRLGQVQLELDDLPAAAESFRRALEQEPADAAATYGLGRIAYSLGNYDEAISYLERGLELQPHASQVHYLLAMSYRGMGDAVEARRHLEQSGQQAVEIEDPLVLSLAGLITGSSVHFELGKQALVAGDVQLAIQEFRKVVEIEPTDYLAYYNLAVALLDSGDRAGARSALNAALQVNPRFRNGHFNLAMMAVEDGRFEEAAQHFEMAHRIDPEDAQAHLEWATALSHIGQQQRALDELQKLIERHPDQYEARLNIGTLLAEMGRRSEAEASWQQLLQGEVEPEIRAAAQRSLGDMANQAGDTEQAIDHYRAAIELDPGSLGTLETLANTLGRLGRFAEAARAFARLEQLDPENLRAHFGYSMALILDEQYQAAREALEQSLQLFVDNVALQHLLARLLATCPLDSVRDGERAVALAEAVMERELTLEHAETLAMALAECERFDEAAEWERRVLEEAQRRDETAVIERARSRLNLYENGQKVRAPWRDDG